MGISLVVMALLIIFGALGLIHFLISRVSGFLVLGIFGILFGILTPVIAYIMFNLNYSNEIEKRRVGFDAETLPFSAMFLIYLRTGFSPRALFEEVSRVKAFEYIAEFASYVSGRMKYFGESVEMALQKALDTVPSALFSDLMSTYVTAVRTGAPVADAIRTKMIDLFDLFRLKANTAADRLSGIGETYVVWLASGFISIFLMIILAAVFPALVSMPMGMVYLLALVFVPVMNLVFALMVEQTQMKFPERQLKANKLGTIMIALGFVLMVVFLLIAGVIENRINPSVAPTPVSLLYYLFTVSGGVPQVVPTATAIALAFVITSIPPYLLARRELSEGTGYDVYIVKFLNSLAEGVKSGLTPETVIRSLKDSKELGKLTLILRVADAYLRLGAPLKDALRKASDKIIDFTSRVAFITLADMIEIGNLTPESIRTLADMIDLQIKVRRDYYSKIKILVAMPYVGVVLAVVAIILMSISIESILTSSSGALYGPIAEAVVLVPKAVYLISVSALFNAITAGLLVGKL
ncbi:MAG: type II secretion system F family protein [Sulfolobales archaeon]|nr:type II secretion system F family protein [Sulfolobales archaeon]